MITITLTKGIPASGKSTWAKEKTKQGKTKRITKDLLREMLDISVYTRSNETFVIKIRDQIIREALMRDLNVIIDDTNFEKTHFDQICLIAESMNKPIHVYEKYFPIDPEVAVMRDINRPNSVGADVIRRFHKRYVLGKTIVEHSKIFTPKSIITPEHRAGLPNALICDLDGTLALFNGRSPYDTKNCINDKVNLPVYLIVKGLNKENRFKIIFVSGREDKYRPETDRWLYEQFTYPTKDTLINPGDELEFNTMPYELYMRPTGDMRKDYIIKKKIFNTHIRDHYNVRLVLDDRPSVCRMWRYELGLTVFQLNDIEF